MFADPITITINGAAKVMARVQSNGTSSVYQTPDGNFKLTISHDENKVRIRSVARLDQRVVATDPLTAENLYATLTTYQVIERPLFGFTVTNVDHQISGFETWMDSTVISKLFGKES